MQGLMEVYFGSEMEEKAGRPYYSDPVTYQNGVASANYVIVIWVKMTPKGRPVRNGRFISYFVRDHSKIKTLEALLARAASQSSYVVAGVKLRKGQFWAGPYLYGCSPELRRE